MVDVKKIDLFSTSLYHFKSDITNKQNKEMLDYIYNKFKDKDVQKEMKLIPFPVDQGKDNLHMESCFSPVLELAKVISSSIFMQEGYLNQEVEITSMWSNKQIYGSVHPPHTHSNNLHSGIYYLKASDKTSGTEFFDPRLQAGVMIPRRTKYILQNSNQYHVSSQTGYGVVFPSWLLHWTPPNKEDRITISWNTIIRGDYGEEHVFQNVHI